MGSNVLVNIVNLGNTQGVLWGEEALVTEHMNSFQVWGGRKQCSHPPYIGMGGQFEGLGGCEKEASWS